jgi:hypothetical protein
MAAARGEKAAAKACILLFNDKHHHVIFIHHARPEFEVEVVVEGVCRLSFDLAKSESSGGALGSLSLRLLTLRLEVMFLPGVSWC